MGFHQTQNAEMSQPRRLEHVTVLVVDDDRHMCKLIKTMLHHMGIKEVRLATDAADAFRELKVFPSDLIISDLRMLPLDGIEFARLVRNAKDIRNHDVPIIMLTGYADMGAVLEALDAGANDFLAKPIRQVAYAAGSNGCCSPRAKRKRRRRLTIPAH